MKPLHRNRITALAILPSFLFCGCSHYYYVANVQNVPMFREKNEYRLAGNFGGGDESSGLDIQAAYSVSDKMGIMANFMTAWGGNHPDGNWARGSLLEGGAGYYKPFAESGIFEIYGGLGASNQHHQYMSGYPAQNNSTADLSSLRVFVQPSVGLSNNLFDIAFSTRFCGLAFTHVNNYTPAGFGGYDELNALESKSHFFLEPALTLRLGWKNVKLQFQTEYSGYVNKPRLDFGEEWHISMGLHIAIANRFKVRSPVPGY